VPKAITSITGNGTETEAAKKNTGPIVRHFNAAIRYAIDMGSIEALKQGSDVYLKRKELL
jgi:hypothetical protein